MQSTTRRSCGLLAIAALTAALPTRAGDSATITITISVEPYASVEEVNSPTMPPLTRPHQTVEGFASFQVTTNHDVVAYLGRPGDAVSGPGGRFRYDDAGAPLHWSANFPGLATGAGLAIPAGAHQLYQVEVHAATGHDWQSATAGSYAGKLSLTLLDR